MEYIDRIFYRKINPSDFKKLYDIDRPETGGGQTYLEAAGITNDQIVDFLAYAEVTNSPLNAETRSIYTFNAYVLGNAANECAMIEFAPRGGRNNYRISRQNMRYKHPAWRVENGFPEPQRNDDGSYISDNAFEGIIDNLVICILRTTYRKYYATFINLGGMPQNWPTNIGLEQMFASDRRGVIRFDLINLQFINSADNPFGEHEPIERIEGGTNTLLYGVPGSGKSWTIVHEYCKADSYVERLVFHPDYTNADFVGQILPVVDEEKQVTYEFTAGPFTTILRDAYTNPAKEYILIIEEVNRGNAPAIFGEVFQLLDRKVEKVDGDDGYPVGTSEYGVTHKYMAAYIYGDASHKIRIPSNLSIIGTMNTSDQNVFTLDTAFQRRWHMRLIENNFDNVRASLANAQILDTGVSWRLFCETVNTIIIGNKAKVASAEDKRLGVYFVHENDMTFDSRAMPSDGYPTLLVEYNDLLRKELLKTITDNEKKRLVEIREAVMHNRMYPEKVIKYLWDDAFKFNPEALFDTDNVESLDEVIRMFVFNRGHDRFKIFKQTVRDTLYPAQQQ